MKKIHELLCFLLIFLVILDILSSVLVNTKGLTMATVKEVQEKCNERFEDMSPRLTVVENNLTLIIKLLKIILTSIVGGAITMTSALIVTVLGHFVILGMQKGQAPINSVKPALIFIAPTTYFLFKESE